MFEDINGNDNDEFKFDAVNICLLVGWAPFVIAWGEYNSAFTEWLVQAYFLTFMVFINFPRWYEKRNLNKSWFWRALALTFGVVHPVILAGMLLVDVWTKTEWHEGATVLSICAVGAILELAVFNKILNYFRPETGETGDRRNVF